MSSRVGSGMEATIAITDPKKACLILAPGVLFRRQILKLSSFYFSSGYLKSLWNLYSKSFTESIKTLIDLPPS